MENDPWFLVQFDGMISNPPTLNVSRYIVACGYIGLRYRSYMVIIWTFDIDAL